MDGVRCWYRGRRKGQVEGVTAWGEGMVELGETRQNETGKVWALLQGGNGGKAEAWKGRGVERINTINTHGSGAQTSNFQLR